MLFKTILPFYIKGLKEVSNIRASTHLLMFPKGTKVVRPIIIKSFVLVKNKYVSSSKPRKDAIRYKPTQIQIDK